MTYIYCSIGTSFYTFCELENYIVNNRYSSHSKSERKQHILSAPEVLTLKMLANVFKKHVGDNFPENIGLLTSFSISDFCSLPDTLIFRYRKIQLNTSVSALYNKLAHFDRYKFNLMEAINQCLCRIILVYKLVRNKHGKLKILKGILFCKLFLLRIHCLLLSTLRFNDFERIILNLNRDGCRKILLAFPYRNTIVLNF